MVDRKGCLFFVGVAVAVFALLAAGVYFSIKMIVSDSLDARLKAIDAQARSVQERIQIIERDQESIRQQIRALEASMRLTDSTSRGYSRTRQVQATLTFYTSGPESTGKRPGDAGYGVTASGRRLNQADAYVVVAADLDYYKFGQRLFIEGIGPAVVADTGAAIKGPDRFDVYVGESVGLARQLGVMKRKVVVVE